MAELIDFQTERVSKHLDNVFRTYLADPAHTIYQQGYLQGLIDLYREGMGKGAGEERIAQLEAQVRVQLEPPYEEHP
jgi:hypothetical protein